MLDNKPAHGLNTQQVDSGGENGNTGGFDQLGRRTVFFGVAVAVLVCVAAYFVLSVVEREGDSRDVPLSAETTYTVEILKFPASHESTLRKMTESQVLKSLVGGHELHLVRRSSDEVALCAGFFDAPSAEQAEAIVQVLEGYTRDGKRPFKRARVIPVSTR
jgi:hypothetical protein